MENYFLCFVDHASLYNLVNKANLVHNLFFVHLSISTCFGRLCAHHREKNCVYATLPHSTLHTRQSSTQHLLLHTRQQEHMLLHTRQSSTQNNKYQVSPKHSCFSWWWAHSRPKHAETDKNTKNKLCTKLALFTRITGTLPPPLSPSL